MLKQSHLFLLRHLQLVTDLPISIHINEENQFIIVVFDLSIILPFFQKYQGLRFSEVRLAF